MSKYAFPFDSLIYNGVDNPRDGIGNHLSLLDQIVFSEIPQTQKSLSTISSLQAPYVYGRVETDLHLKHPDNFRNGLFLDIARETWDVERIRLQMEKTVRHKRTFNSVTAVYLMWESDRLWDQYSRLIGIYDFCIVTSSLLDEQLNAMGVDFVKLPHPYIFSGLDTPTPTIETNKVIRFGISAGFWPRKNVSLLATTFADTFAQDPNVMLSIHTRFNPHIHDLREQSEKLQNLASKHNNIEIIHQSFSREEFVGWMNSLDVYCFVSSGEGYSVTPREALHLGVPVVLHDAHVHSEFSHLPGVIPVPSSGRQKAISNSGNSDFDIGMDWQVDKTSLKKALTHARHNHVELKKDIVAGYDSIVKLHDPESIRAQWTEVLSEKFSRYRDRTVLYYPKVPEPVLISHSTSMTHLNLFSPEFKAITGHFSNGQITCLQSEHDPGYCLHGPYFSVLESAQYLLTLSIQIFNAELPDHLFDLALYDSGTGKCLLKWEVNKYAIKGVENTFQIHVDARIGQILEIRIFWHGDCDICVTGLNIENILEIDKLI